MIIFKHSGNSWLSTIGGLLLLTAISAGLIFMASVVVRLLYLLGPLLLIAVLFIDRRVLLDYLRWVGQTLKRRFVQGVVVIVLSIIGYPFVAVFLLLRAVFQRKVSRMQDDYTRRQQGELAEFEEINSTPASKGPSLQRRTDDDYADFV